MSEHEPLLAITFHRPWPSAILYQGKDCENRTRPPPRAVLGKRVALHAGKKYGIGRWPSPAPWPSSEDCPIGIVGTAVVGGWLDERSGRVITVAHEMPLRAGILRGRDLATQRARHEIPFDVRVDALRRSPWWAGPVGILFLDPQPLKTPIACSGALGWWRVPSEIAAAIRGQFVRTNREGVEP